MAASFSIAFDYGAALVQAFQKDDITTATSTKPRAKDSRRLERAFLSRFSQDAT
jgi:hypothetical protein